MTSEPVIKLVDLVLQIFGILKETPVMALGINYTEHWRLDSWEQRVALGRALAPPGPWGDWGKSWDDADPEKVGGMTNLAVLKPFPNRKGKREATIGPSTELADATRGVYLRVNHHREPEIKEGDGAQAASALLAEEFDEAIAAARAIIVNIRDFAKTLDTK